MLAVLLAVTMMPERAQAAGSLVTGHLQTTDENGKPSNCDAIPEAAGGILLGKIVPCLIRTVEVSASRFSFEFIDWMRPTFYSFLVITIIFFGVKILQGEGQLQAHGIVLLLKIGFVLALFEMIPYTLLPLIYNIMSESQDIVLGALDTHSMHCEVDKFGNADTPMIWAQMDCLLGKLYGFTVGGTDANGNAQPSMLLASSIIGMLTGFFFGGTLGVAVFFLCLGTLWSMFSLVIKVVTSFINAYMIIALYMIISPLFLPLMFFRVTTPYFDRWSSAIIAAILMPIIICAYMIFALQMYDRVMFADDSLVKNLFNYEFMKQNQLPPSKACDLQFTNDPGYRAEAAGAAEKDIYGNNPWLQNKINSFLNGSQGPCAMLDKTNFDWGAFKDKNGNVLTTKETFTKFFRELAIIFIITILIDAGFRTLQGAIRPILQSGSVAALLDTRSKQEEAINRALQQGKQAMQRTYSTEEGTRSGQDFVRATPAAMRNAVTGMMYGIRDEYMPEDAYTQPPGSGETSSTARPSGTSSSAAGTTTPQATDDATTPPPTTPPGAAGSSAAATGSSAARTPVRTLSPNERRQAAEAVLAGNELQRFNELDQKSDAGSLSDEEKLEYDALLDRIDNSPGGGN